MQRRRSRPGGGAWRALPNVSGSASRDFRHERLRGVPYRRPVRGRQLPPRQARGEARVSHVSSDRRRARSPDVRAATRLRHLSSSDASRGPLRDLPPPGAVRGSEAGRGDGDSARARAACTASGLSSREARLACVRRVSHDAGHARAITDGGAVQGLPRRPSYGRPRLCGVPCERQSEKRAQEPGDGPPAMRRVPHANDHRTVDPDEKPLHHLPHGKGDEAPRPDGMHRLPLPR